MKRAFCTNRNNQKNKMPEENRFQCKRLVNTDYMILVKFAFKLNKNYYCIPQDSHDIIEHPKKYGLN